VNIIDISFAGSDAEIDKEKVETLCNEVLLLNDINSSELSVVFCTDQFMRDLNKRYRDHDEPTDVLSFETMHTEASEPCRHAGDIVLSLDTIKRNSEELAVNLDEELKRCIIHGILHLAGYNHTENPANDKMILLQEDILSKFQGVNLL